MAVINDPNTAANIAAVGAKAFSPVHNLSGPYPVGAGGAFRLSMTSGTIAASLAANSELFQFRYAPAGTRVALVYGLTVSAAIVAAPAVGVTPINMQLAAKIARTWSADGTGGTAATLTGNNQKLRTSLASSEVVSARMATTTGLGAGTKSFDTQNLGAINSGLYFDLAATGLLTTIFQGSLLGEFSAGLAYPLVLASQEGFSILSGVAMPATMTWNLIVNVLWSEVDTF